MANSKVRFHGKVHSKAVKGLPPGMKREVLTAACTDSAGNTWPKGAEFVAQSGGYDNTAHSSYVDAVML